MPIDIDRSCDGRMLRLLSGIDKRSAIGHVRYRGQLYLGKAGGFVRRNSRCESLYERAVIRRWRGLPPPYFLVPYPVVTDELGRRFCLRGYRGRDLLRGDVWLALHCGCLFPLSLQPFSLEATMPIDIDRSCDGRMLRLSIGIDRSDVWWKRCHR